MGEVILEMKGIDKSFPGVHALDHVDLEIRKGEVLALMGENGAGKSSLFNLPGSLSFWSAILIQTMPCFLSLTFDEICRIFYLSVVFLKGFHIVQGNVPSSLPVHRAQEPSYLPGTLQARKLFLRSP